MSKKHPENLYIAIVFYLIVFGLDAFWSLPLQHAIHQIATVGGETAHIARLFLVVLIVGVSLGAWIFLAYTASRLEFPAPLAGGLAAVFLVAWACLTFLAPSPWLRVNRMLIDPYKGVSYLCLALASTFLGQLISRAFKDRNLVAAGVVVGGAVDFWGVNSSFGTTRAFIHHFPALHQQIAVHLPMLSVPQVGIVDPMVGPGDYIFAGIMLSLVTRFELKPITTAWLMWVLLFASMMAVVMACLSVPAVAPMAAAVLLPNLREFKFSRTERFAMLYAALLLLALAGVWWLMVKH